MPATVSVNMLTVVHQASNGVTIAFPDVCKTPSPAGPIPIPYPNIAQASDSDATAKKVSNDGHKICVKDSNFKMSSADEAGSLFGLMSSKNKGKAYPANASFDVKADGQAVFRLSDPMKTRSSRISMLLAHANHAQNASDTAERPLTSRRQAGGTNGQRGISLSGGKHLVRSGS